jgi:hypothetical protein
VPVNLLKSLPIALNWHGSRWPGLNLVEPSTDPVAEEQPVTEHRLSPNSKWRFEVAYGLSVEVKIRPLAPRPNSSSLIFLAPQWRRRGV